MEALLILAVLIPIGYALYRSGKRVGSQKRLSRRFFPRSPAAPLAKSIPPSRLAYLRPTSVGCGRPTGRCTPHPRHGGLFFTYRSLTARKDTTLGTGQVGLLSTSCIWQDFVPDGLSTARNDVRGRFRPSRRQVEDAYPKGWAASGSNLIPRQAARFIESRARRAHRLTTIMSQLDSFYV